METRRCHVVRDIEWLEGKESWKGLCSLIKVHSTTEHLLEGRISEDTRYYISSLSKTAQDCQIESEHMGKLKISYIGY